MPMVMDFESEVPVQMAGPDDAVQFADMARSFHAEEDLGSMVARICEAAEQVDGDGQAGVILVAGQRRLAAAGGGGPLAERMAAVQLSTGEGPALDALAPDRPVLVVDDLTGEHRWPRFAAAAVETGLRSALCLRLELSGRVYGVLSLWSPTPGAFSADRPAHRRAGLLAAHASTAVATAKLREDMRAALESRSTISIAMGILMARQEIDSDEAFNVLRRASQRLNVKLRDLARDIAASATGSPDPLGSTPTVAERARMR